MASGSTRRLVDLASTIRSKNAGPDHITFDILFKEKKDYEEVKQSGVLNKASVAALYNVPVERVVRFVEFDPAMAIKFTIRRTRPSGSPGEHDVMGSQQYPVLFDIEIPVNQHK